MDLEKYIFVLCNWLKWPSEGDGRTTQHQQQIHDGCQHFHRIYLSFSILFWKHRWTTPNVAYFLLLKVESTRGCVVCAVAAWQNLLRRICLAFERFRIYRCTNCYHLALRWRNWKPMSWRLWVRSTQDCRKLAGLAPILWGWNADVEFEHLCLWHDTHTHSCGSFLLYKQQLAKLQFKICLS